MTPADAAVSAALGRVRAAMPGLVTRIHTLQQRSVALHPSLASLPLIQPSDLQYQGAFRVPPQFSYAVSAVLAWSAVRHSLYISDRNQTITEVSVPALHASTTVAGLPLAAPQYPGADVLEGRWNQVNPGDPNAIMLGGLLATDTQLITSVYAYYDGNGTQKLTHFASGLDPRVKGDVIGPVQLGARPPIGAPSQPSDLKAGYLSGYMCAIPKPWQAALGGTALTGNGALAIISRSSLGPGLVAFNPLDIGAVSPVPVTALCYYDMTHPTLGAYGSTGTRFNGTAEYRGCVFPEGSRSVLVFGRIGVGRYDYGSGTTVQALDGKPIPGTTDHYVYDPWNTDKGPHAAPYEYRVWAYDALDLAAVKAGTKQPWQVEPYAVWAPTFGPLTSPGALLGGAAYDQATGRIFIAVRYIDGGPPTDRPVIAVLTVN